MTLKPSTRRKGFVIKFIFRDHSLNLRINLWNGLLTLALVGAMVWGLSTWVEAKINNYHQRVADLERSNSQYRSALALKERENQQIAALAQERFEELCSELENQDDTINSINKSVGKANNKRRSLRGSRSGTRHISLDLKLKYKELIDTVSARNSDLEQLQAVAKRYRERVERERLALAMSRTPSMWPVRGEITSDFGSRFHPVYGYSRFHAGLDIAAPSGQPIVATAAGAVVSAGWMQGYGYAVEIRHANNLSTLYGHCSQLLVNAGQQVQRGQNIALVGSTGVSTGPHCHYEVLKNGRPVNPLPYLYRNM